MNLVLFVWASVLILSVVFSLGNKYIKPIIKISSKWKYEMIGFFTIVFLGIFIARVIDYREMPVISGTCFGVLEGIVKILIKYESKSEYKL